MPIFRAGASDPRPYWSALGATLYLGDVREQLMRLPARSVHCAVTSPPYWGLRSYLEVDHPNKRYEIGAEPSPDCGTHGQAQCGECFVCAMVGVFREVYRVLRDDGTLWLNLGDTYINNAKGASGGVDSSGLNRSAAERQLLVSPPSLGRKIQNCDVPNSNLVGVPWRAALALQADGWVLRSDVPWVKRSAMPESVENRPCKSLEYMFLLAKGEGYYFDMDAVRRASTTPAGSGGACFGRVRDGEAAKDAGAHSRRYERPDYTDRAFRNSDLWMESVEKPHGAVGIGDELVGLDVTPETKGNKGKHFAVFPSSLITPLILASTSEHGCCASCGRPWTRIVKKTVESVRPEEAGQRAEFDAAYGSLKGFNDGLRDGYKRRRKDTVGWQRTCGCRTDEVVLCTVLDPFVGSGTTVATAIQLGRAGIGIDLSESYLREVAIPRIEGAMGAVPTTSPKPTVALPAVAPPAPRRMRGVGD